MLRYTYLIEMKLEKTFCELQFTPTHVEVGSADLHLPADNVAPIKHAKHSREPAFCFVLFLKITKSNIEIEMIDHCKNNSSRQMTLDFTGSRSRRRGPCGPSSSWGRENRTNGDAAPGWHPHQFGRLQHLVTQI